MAPTNCSIASKAKNGEKWRGASNDFGLAYNVAMSSTLKYPVCPLCDTMDLLWNDFVHSFILLLHLCFNHC